MPFERGGYPPGPARQGAALLSDAWPRSPCPPFVVQGARDQFASWRVGQMIADAIPGARFVLFDEMGHSLPRALWPTVIDEVITLTTQADAAIA